MHKTFVVLIETIIGFIKPNWMSQQVGRVSLLVGTFMY
jgi:hypothetical protein